MSAVALVSPVRILGASGTAASNAADTAKLTLGTFTIPAGLMGTRGIVRIFTQWSYTSSVNNKVLTVEFGGTAFMNATAAAQTGGFAITTIQNRDSASSQVGSSELWTNNSGQIATAVATASVATTSAVTVNITGQKTLAGETLTLESWYAELITP